MFLKLCKVDVFIQHLNSSSNVPRVIVTNLSKEVLLGMLLTISIWFGNNIFMYEPSHPLLCYKHLELIDIFKVMLLTLEIFRQFWVHVNRTLKVNMVDVWGVFIKMPFWNVITWIAMILVHVKCRQWQKTLNYFGKWRMSNPWFKSHCVH